MVGHPGSERVVLGAVSGGLARPLLGLVGPPPGLLARLARGGCRGSDGAGADAAATGGLGQLLELVGGLVWVAVVGLVTGLTAVLIGGSQPGDECGSPAGAGQVVLGPAGSGQIVGASEYGGPGDPTSGTVGASGVSLREHPDSYAELG